MGEAFEGVPLATHDFGETHGESDVGTTDTIVARKESVEVPDSGSEGTIEIELVALQLRSVNPVALEADPGESVFQFVTLQEEQASRGTITIRLGSTESEPLLADYEIALAFDLRRDAFDGDIIDSGTLWLTATDVPWARQSADPDVLEIPGVNAFLNGEDRSGDFFPSPFTLSTDQDNGLDHAVRTARIPEPGTLFLMATAIIGMLVGMSMNWAHPRGSLRSRLDTGMRMAGDRSRPAGESPVPTSAKAVSGPFFSTGSCKPGQW